MFDEAVSNHEAHEGHEEILFVLCVPSTWLRTGLCGKIHFFLRALRVLRGEICIFFLVAASTRWVSAVNTPSQ
jgi:hypothetical protein